MNRVIERKRITKSTLLHRKDSQLSSKNYILIIYFFVSVKNLFNIGKDYPWHKPDVCPGCKGRRLWGHGYTQRCFSDLTQKLWVKRYRCPDCDSVHTMRPATHWRRFHTSISNILRSLINKIKRNRWISSLPRQNQQYWFKGLIFQASHLVNILSPTVDVLRGLISRAVIPASHSMHCEILRL